jgi:hypothetical protein
MATRNHASKEVENPTSTQLADAVMYWPLTTAAVFLTVTACVLVLTGWAAFELMAGTARPVIQATLAHLLG